MDSGILYVVFNKWISNPDTGEIPYKIGITRGSVEDRYYGLGLKMPGKFETLFAYEFDDCSKAEKLIHGILDKKRGNGEWFKLNQKELDHIKTTCEIMEGKLVTNEVENEIKNEIEAEPLGITGKDILDMKIGDTIYDFLTLIPNSKVPHSKNWAGEGYIIKNTPMKGINWIGNDSEPLAVIIRTTGKYGEEGVERYAFEAKNGRVDKTIKSNQLLINQPKYNYPILYFCKEGSGSKYKLIGKYSVDKVFDTYVTLIPFRNDR